MAPVLMGCCDPSLSLCQAPFIGGLAAGPGPRGLPPRTANAFQSECTSTLPAVWYWAGEQLQALWIRDGFD